MILNGYDTFVGSRIRLSDNIPTTLKMLATTDRLKNFGSSSDVKILDNESGSGIKTFVFPITLNDYRGNRITVMDARHYINSKGKVINSSEYEMMLTAALLQQLVAKNSKSILNGSKPYVLKAFVKSIAGVLSRPSNGNLNLNQRNDLEIILGHYYNCLLTNPNDDFIFVSQNALNQSLRIAPNSSFPVIKEIGYIDNFKDLLNAIKEYPTLSSLSKLDLGGFVGVVNQTWFASSGFREIVGASVEMPHLYTAICYASATNNIYKRTAIGAEVDIKQNRSIENFVRMINGIWPGANIRGF